MNTYEKLCSAHEKYRFQEHYDYYNVLTDSDRLYIKSSISFLYEYYTAQHTHITSSTQQYTLCTIDIRKRPADFLLALLPSSLSIPPLIALLLPAQILNIPLIINFPSEPSPYILTALELMGIEDIFIGAEQSLTENYKQQSHGIAIHSADYMLPRTLWQYIPPLCIAEDIQEAPFTWLYPDAQYTTAEQAHLSHTRLKHVLHLWVYPSLTLDCYYCVDYTMR